MRRFTVEDESKLNEHLNEIASKGWRFHSMKPIIKGAFFDYQQYKEGYGNGFNILEGFVLIWEIA